jgi:predicted lipid-binding transport protein (Tim44 family)
MSKMWNRFALAAMLAASTALTISVVEARPGGSKSSGSRGSLTNSAPPSTATTPRGAQPMERSVTQGAPAQRPAAAQPGAATPGAATPGAAAAAQQAARPSMARNIMTGMAFGFLGAGLFGLLSGAGFFSGLASLAGLFGFLLQIALIAGVVWLVMRLIRSRREPAVSAPSLGRASQGAAPDAMNRNAMSRQAAMAGGMGGGVAAAPMVQPLNLGGDDFNRFEGLLTEVQEAYSRADVGALRSLSTPEMAAYMEGDIADAERNGLVNRVSNIKLLQGDLSEAWSEASADYATVAMRYSITDVMVEKASGRVVEGDTTRVDEVTEYWTFTRERGEDHAGWRLSAIQQAA